MNLDDLLYLNREFVFFYDLMTPIIKENIIIKSYKESEIIINKNDKIKYFGIIVKGACRVINEFENGRLYLIENNEAIDYIGDVAILAGKNKASVTITADKLCIIAFIEKRLAEERIFSTNELLRELSKKVAYKLYRSSDMNGMNIIYSSEYIFLDYISRYIENESKSKRNIKLDKTRDIISQDTGLTVKTINRIIYDLKKKSIISTEKGKIVMNIDNYREFINYKETVWNKEVRD